MKEKLVPKYRLQFKTYSMLLKPGSYTIGRGEQCEICIQDQKVSRKHAQLQVTEDTVYISDLGSSNGTYVNGTAVDNEVLVSGGDCVRIGAHDLFFTERLQSRVEIRNRQMTRCSACGATIELTQSVCHTCGANNSSEATQTAARFDQPQSWSVEFPLEQLEKALENNNSQEAVSLFEKSVQQIETQLNEGRRPDAAFVSDVAAYALKIADVTKAPGWIAWALRLHRKISLIPDAQTVDKLGQLDWVDDAHVISQVQEFVYWYRAIFVNPSLDGQARLSQIEQLCKGWSGLPDSIDPMAQTQIKKSP